MIKPPPVCTLWIGPTLPPLAQASLGSHVAAGHEVRLFAYQPLDKVPPGVVFHDAAEILPERLVVRHSRSGSLAMFANRFRYELLARELGVWVDADVLCLRPYMLPKSRYLFGWETSTSINNAVLCLPANSPILAQLRAIFTEAKFVPPWVSLNRRIRYRLGYLLRGDFGVHRMGWGVTGPRALTYLLARDGLAELAEPAEVFYPVPIEAAAKLATPGADIGQWLTPRSHAIHLWHTELQRFDKEPPPAGSFLAAVVDGSWQDQVKAGPRAASSR